ncbi:hypothetical protein Pelo_5060 [Pelomyxa schiedti]|nr:hypothetical protein Pelo_5060 [Pelomyxa schiedti]
MSATGFDFGKNLLRCVWIGMLLGVQDLCNSLNSPKINHIYSTMSEKIDRLTAGMSWGIDTHSRYGMTKVNVTFLTGVLAQFQACCQDQATPAHPELRIPKQTFM